MPSCGLLRRVDLKNQQFRGTYRLYHQGNKNRNVLRLLITAKVPTPLILVTLMMEAIRSSETSVLIEPLGVTSQKTVFFIVTAVKT
jgi:hypothetical protein